MSTILDHIQDHESIELTQQLIRIPSFLWQESEIGRWLANWMSQRGYEVELQEVPLQDGGLSHQAIGALRGNGGGPSLMLCGHTDTSDWNGDVFRRDQWRYDPFGAEIDSGLIYGLGALNMKAGLAAMLIAAEAIRRSGSSPKGDLILACVVAETGGGVGALHLIESGCRPEYCIVTEAGDLDVGLISVGYVQGQIRVCGEFKHRAPYVNPIEKATKVIDAFSPSYAQIPAKADGGWLRYQPHPLIPGYPAMAIRDIAHYQDMTTVTFDLRIVPGMTEDTVREDMEARLEQIRQEDSEFEYELVIPQSEQQPNMPAREATPLDSPVVSALIAAHKQVTGAEPRVGAGHRIGATADTCHFKGAGITCVEYGPGFIPTWPMVDECVCVDQVITATQTLALTAEALLL
ncbi:MAG: M20/M25/M40 family metallo-hydrolase [Chloroflexota bacterium]|nr:M20/M25/M40 family metallo-hydrolase [Chloroflexota bacterium]